LKGQEVEIDLKDKEILKPLRDFWSDPNLDLNEKFLRDYILNNKYADKESYDLEYNQVIHDSDENLSEDEKTIQKQEEFEHKYNFRFEEPDQEFIKRFVFNFYLNVNYCICYNFFFYSQILRFFKVSTIDGKLNAEKRYAQSSEESRS